MSKPAKTLQSQTTRLTKEQVHCTGCGNVYQRPAYSLAAKDRDQIMECPCGAKTRISGEHES